MSDDRATPHLPGWDLESLEDSDDIVCVVDRDLVIRWTNAAWRDFATANGGAPDVLDEWSEHVCYADAIPPPLRDLYGRRYVDCLRRGTPWSHDYECSSPELYRRYHQVAYPVGGAWIVIVNALTVERPHDETDADASPLDADDYRDEQGYLTQCMHCRRLRRPAAQAWDWVPSSVARQPRDTQVVLCPPCFDFYYPEGEAAA